MGLGHISDIFYDSSETIIKIIKYLSICGKKLPETVPLFIILIWVLLKAFVCSIKTAADQAILHTNQ